MRDHTFDDLDTSTPAAPEACVVCAAPLDPEGTGTIDGFNGDGRTCSDVCHAADRAGGCPDVTELLYLRDLFSNEAAPCALSERSPRVAAPGRDGAMREVTLDPHARVMPGGMRGLLTVLEALAVRRGVRVSAATLRKAATRHAELGWCASGLTYGLDLGDLDGTTLEEVAHVARFASSLEPGETAWAWWDGAWRACAVLTPG